MALDIEIANIDESGSTLDIDVFVTVDGTETVDYEVNINDTGTGGTVTRSGTLAGGAGSFPGDSETISASFSIGDTTGGTVTAVVTAPDRYVGPEFQDQELWGDEGSGQPGGPDATISGCESNPTPEGDLSVTYTLAPTTDDSVEQEVTVRVDGRYVGDATHTVPRRGGRFKQTIPAVNLPTGEEMPVEVGVGEDFSDCGTVTVDGAAGGSITITECDATATGPAVTVTAALTGSVPVGEVSISIVSGREGFGGSEVVEVPTALDGTQIEATISPDWDSGQHTVEMEAAIFDASGEVVGTDTTACGTVTLEGAPERPDINCAPVVEQYGALMAEYGTPGQQFGREGVSNAIAAWRADEITTDELRGLLDAWRGRCTVPGRNNSRLLLGALGVGALGVGYAVSRRQ